MRQFLGSKIFKRVLAVTLLMVLFTGFAISFATSDFSFAGVSGVLSATMIPVMISDEEAALLGKRRKTPGAETYVKGAIRGGVNIATALATRYSVFGQNATALNTALAGSGVLTNQTGQAGTYGEEGHFLVKALKFNIVNLFTTGLDYFTAKQLAQYGTAQFVMGGTVLWEGWLYDLMKDDIRTYNVNIPADSVLISNVFNTVSLGEDGYRINKGDSFEMNITLSAAVTIPAAEVTKWYFTCGLLGKKTLANFKTS